MTPSICQLKILTMKRFFNYVSDFQGKFDLHCPTSVPSCWPATEKIAGTRGVTLVIQCHSSKETSSRYFWEYQSRPEIFLVTVKDSWRGHALSSGDNRFRCRRPRESSRHSCIYIAKASSFPGEFLSARNRLRSSIKFR